MRIVVDRNEMVHVAQTLRRDSYNLASVSDSFVGVPTAGLPAGLASRVAAAVATARRDVQSISTALQTDAADLERRAFWAGLAGGEMSWWSFIGMLLGFQAGAFGFDRAYLDCLSPAERYRLLQGLDPDEQIRLAEMYPELIGSLDGAPFHMRYAANRVLIKREIARLEDQLGRTSDSGARSRLLDRIARFESWSSPRRNFLLFDPRGDGRAAEVFGELEHAKYVAVIVPGMGTDFGNFNGFGASANAFFGEMSQQSERSATIAWLGYDPPDDEKTVVDPRPWMRGAPDLAAFTAGIRGANASAKLTVIGHSYGSTLTGSAIKHGLNADHVIFVGSPGVPLLPNDIPRGMDVYVVRTHDDPVRHLETLRDRGIPSPHGLDPVELDFPRISAEGSKGHTLAGEGYLKANSKSADGMAYVATHYETGRPDTLSEWEELKEDARGLVSDARKVGRKATDAAGWVVDRAQDAGEWVGDQAQDAGDWVGDQAEDAGDWVGDRAEDVGDWVEDAPWLPG